MNTYETIFICPADIPQEKIDATVDKVKSVITRSEGNVTTAELWGRKKLAYSIRGAREGFYVYMVFSGPAQISHQLDRHFRVTDTIVRGLTVKIDSRRLAKLQAPLKTTPDSSVPTAEAAPTSTTEPESIPPETPEIKEEEKSV